MSGDRVFYMFCACMAAVIGVAAAVVWWRVFQLLWSWWRTEKEGGR